MTIPHVETRDSSACLDDIPNTKERVLAVKTFLEGKWLHLAS